MTFAPDPERPNARSSAICRTSRRTTPPLSARAALALLYGREVWSAPDIKRRRDRSCAVGWLLRRCAEERGRECPRQDYHGFAAGDAGGVTVPPVTMPVPTPASLRRKRAARRLCSTIRAVAARDP